jgi:hypothetical protein
LVAHLVTGSEQFSRRDRDSTLLECRDIFPAIYLSTAIRLRECRRMEPRSKPFIGIHIFQLFPGGIDFMDGLFNIAAFLRIPGSPR